MLILILFLSIVFTLSDCTYSRQTIVYPADASSRGVKSDDGWKAKRLFECARRENSMLVWNDCLAKIACSRARTLFDKGGRLTHRDDRTGKNPAWEMIRECLDWRYAGENLVRGDEPPENLHSALMQSASHRSTIVSRKYHYMGVGCCGEVCVELFAGT